ncbi:hypothetical protein C0J26_07565 [Pseudomonas baetica]|nr:hypothetical protein C0J26_07565 [Pseudomonas baetica]
MYIIIICSVVWTLFRITFSKATNEQDPSYPTTSRYKMLANLCAIAVGLVLVFPYKSTDDGENDTMTMTDKFNADRYRWGSMAEAGTISYAIADIQVGNTQTDFMSESSRPYSPSYFKAKNISMEYVKAQLLDDRTAKTYYQKINIFLPVSERRVDFNSQPEIYQTETGFTVKRLIAGKTTQDSTLAELMNTEFISAISLPSYVQKAADRIKGQYLTSSPEQFKPMLAGFKKAIMQELDLEKPNQIVNNAVHVQASNLLREYFANPSVEKFHLAKDIARLVQEQFCTESTPNLDVLRDGEKYIQFLKGQLPNSVFESKIGCVASKGNDFVVLGTRSKEEIYQEMFTKLKALTNEVNKGTEAIEIAVAATTVDESNSISCVRARKEQGVGFAIHYRNCLIGNQANKEIMQNTNKNYRIIANGDGNYIDTNFALRNNADKSNLLNDDFDSIINELYNSIPMKVELSQVDDSEYIASLIEGNLGDESSLSAAIGAVLNPTSQLKKTLGMGKDCEKAFYTCMNPVNAYVGLYNMSGKMIDVGFYTGFFSFASANIMAKYNKQDDKSMKLSNKDSGKGRSKFKKGLAFVEGAMRAFSTLGIFLWVMGWFIRLVLILPVLLFVVAAILIIFQMVITFVIGIARFMWLFLPNDKNNFLMNIRMLANEIIYDLTIKSLLVFLQVLFYPVMGFVLWLVCYGFIALASTGGFEQQVVAVICFAPVLYFIHIHALQGFVNIITLYTNFFAGNVMMADALKNVIDKYLSIVTLGLPLGRIILKKRTKS